MSITAHSLGAPRNGMPERKPYVYRGDPKAAETERKLARIRAQAARNQQIRERPAVIAPPEPAPAPVNARCEKCGYLEARCCCPGGPRG